MSNTFLHVLPQLVALGLLLRSIQAGWVSATDIGLRRPEGPVWPYLSFFVAYTAGVEVFNYWRGAIEIAHWNLSRSEAAVRVLGIVVLAPIIEEWIFRGVLLEVLGRRLSFVVANVLQAIAFVLLHVPDLINGSASLLDWLIIMLDALFYGWMRCRTHSLYPGMLAHALGNSLAVFERLL